MDIRNNLGPNSNKILLALDLEAALDAPDHMLMLQPNYACPNLKIKVDRNLP